LLQRGGKRLHEERTGCYGGVLLLFGGGCSRERDAPAVFGFPQRREFPGEQTVWCLLRQYSKYADHFRKPVFFGPAAFYSSRTPREILLLEEIQGKNAPGGTPF
jgi:hypothetical protein